MRRENTRRSFLSGKPYPRKMLIRFALENGKIVVDEKNAILSRGAYLLLEEIPLALAKNSFAKAFKKNLTNEEEEAIKNYYDKRKKA